MKDLDGRVPAAPGYSAEPEPVSTHSLGPSGEYPSRCEAGVDEMRALLERVAAWRDAGVRGPDWVEMESIQRAARKLVERLGYELDED